MKFKKKNIITILFFLTVFSLDGFCNLLPISNYIIPNVLKYSDIGIIIAIIWSLLVYVATKGRKKKYNYGFRREIFFIILLFIISTFVSNYYFSQSIFTGLNGMRNRFICFFLYFPIVRAIENNILTKEDFYKIIFTVSFLELIVYIFQFILVDKFIFTYIDTSEMRNETVRLRFPYLFPLAMSYLSIDYLFNKKTNKIRSIFFIVGSILLVAVICKHRAPSLIVVFTYLLAFLFFKGTSLKKIFIGIILATIAIPIFSQSYIFNSTVDVLFKNDQTTSNTLNIRQDGREYYFEKLKSSPIVGYGHPNMNSQNAMIASGVSHRYYLADNGVFGFAYCYGILGILVLALLIYNMTKKSLTIYKNTGDLSMLLYCIFEIINLYMGMHWYYYYQFPFVLMIVIITIKYNELEKEKKI